MELPKHKRHSFKLSSNSSETSSNSSQKRHSKLGRSISLLFHKKAFRKQTPNKCSKSGESLTRCQIEEIKNARIRDLPQEFHVQLLGVRPCVGINGLDALRDPIDDMISTVCDLHNNEQVLMPASVIISYTGITEHSMPNTAEFMLNGKDQQPTCSSATSDNPPAEDSGLYYQVCREYDIQSISYGAQDIQKHPCVFSFILVHYFSENVVNADCHSYLCQSPLDARHMALSMKLAYELVQDQLNYSKMGTLKIGSTIEVNNFSFAGDDEYDA